MRRGLRLLPVLLFVAACAPGPSAPPLLPTGPSGAATADAAATPADIWESLQERGPYPWSTPLPPADPTSIDGTYVKFEPYELLGEHIHCRRCPDWLYEGGLWRLRFDRGVYRVLHVDLGWKSLGSYTVSGTQLRLFNDPNCIHDTGVYEWTLEDGRLTFRVVDDLCAILLRGKNLEHLAWQSCQAPSQDDLAATWTAPPGCD